MPGRQSPLEAYRDECLKMMREGFDSCIKALNERQTRNPRFPDIDPESFEAAIVIHFPGEWRIACTPGATFPVHPVVLNGASIIPPPHPTPDNLADAFKLVGNRSPQVVRMYLNPLTFESMVRSIEYQDLVKNINSACRIVGEPETHCELWGASIRLSNDVPKNAIALIESNYQYDVLVKDWKPEPYQLFEYDGLKVTQQAQP